MQIWNFFFKMETFLLKVEILKSAIPTNNSRNSLHKSEYMHITIQLLKIIFFHTYMV